MRHSPPATAGRAPELSGWVPIPGAHRRTAVARRVEDRSGRSGRGLPITSPWAAFTVYALGAGLATAAFVLAMAWQLGGVGTANKIDGITEFGAAFVGGFTCILAGRLRQGRERTAWRAIGLGVVLWALGQVAWCWYDLVRAVTVPLPSVADVGFLAALPLIAGGVLLLPSAPGSVFSRARFALDGVIVAASLFAILWGTVLASAVHGIHLRPLGAAVAITYPMGDVVIATIAICFLVRASHHYQLVLALLTAGVLMLAVSDSSGLFIAQREVATRGLVVDVGWVGGFLLLGLASLVPRPATERTSAATRLVTNWQVALPYTLLVGAETFVLSKLAIDGRIDAFLLADGLALGVIVLVRQFITLLENTQLARQLSFQALHDPLTGLGNRSLFSDRVRTLLFHASREATPVAVLLCDLDGFKDVNDTLGHSVGDALLIAVADRLRVSLRASDTVARVGGDEFAIILGEVLDIEQVSAIARRVIDAMREPFVASAREYSPLISIGISLQQGPGVTVESFLRDADVALYAAKAAGGNTFRFFEPSMATEHFQRLQLHADLAAALGRDEFFLEYEPIVALATGEVVGVEALLRWRHPHRGLLHPDEFLAEAEASGEIAAIGEWALREATRQMGAWRDRQAAPARLWLSVNVSPRQLEGPIVDIVYSAIASSGVPGSAIRLELTEEALVRQADARTRKLEGLKASGAKIVIDDFGTGYSSLGYLRWLPFDGLKIDRSFLADAGSDPYTNLIVEAMVQLGHARGVEVVAEGIETLAQLEAMRTVGCDLGQGFWWCRASSPDDFERWVDEYEPARADLEPQRPQ